MKADEILRKHEDANEMHFHEVDRKWIIEAMEEYAALRQTLVISSVCDCEAHTFYEWEKDENKCSQCNKRIYKQTDL